jgi:hypothetical protein
MIPDANHVTHNTKYQAFKTLKITPRRIANNGNIIKINIVIACLIVFERFNSIIYHILSYDLLPL